VAPLSWKYTPPRRRLALSKPAAAQYHPQEARMAQRIDLVDRALDALHILASQLPKRTGASRRTVQRWFSKESSPGNHHLQELARHVFPVDRELAAELAEAGGSSLDALGLLARETLANAPPPVPAPPPLAAEDLVDSVVCAAAEESGLAPRAVRPVLLAAFARARALRMDVAAVERGLRARVGAKA
jgi:hypothetical protein